MKVNSSTPRIRVVKVGGSLFDIPDLRRRLLSWLNDRPEFSAFVAGGGESVDRVLLLARQQSLSEQQIHWLAIKEMSTTARRLAELLSPCAIRTTPIELCESAASDRFCVVDCEALLREDAGCTLPESNDVSSDSIA